MFFGGCSKRSGEKKESTKIQISAQEDEPEIKKIVDAAYDFKQTGQNGSAMALFKKAAVRIESSYGKKSEAYASILDDQGTCYLRAGNYGKARRLFKEANAILEELSLDNTRLFTGIQGRLEMLDAFEKNNIVCEESLEETVTLPISSQNKENAIPYFPTSESLYKVFYHMSREIKGCVEKTSKAIPVWNVVLGDGRLLMSSVISDDVSSDQAKCIEEKLSQAALKHRDDFPRFRACYRNYTYPLVFRE